MSKDKKRTILYIEDDPDSMELIKLLLEENNFNVIEAHDGFKGIELLNKKKVDLILIDINIPDMNGLEIATRIKSIDSYKGIPLIALTADIMRNTRDIALIAGCNGFLKKPINTQTIVNQLNEYLNGKKEEVKAEKIIDLMREYNTRLVSHLESEIKELKIANKDLKEIDKLKSNFISIVSHELKTPLASILGFINLLLTNRFGEISEKQSEILNIIAKDTKKLEKIVMDMITVSLLENKSLDLIIEKNIDIEILVKNIIDELKTALNERELIAKVIVDGDVPLIECDSVKILQAFRNIISNSIKNIEDEGEINIYFKHPSERIREKYLVHPENYLEIVIEDNGIDIPDDKINKIFNNFFEPIDINKHYTPEKEFFGSGIRLDLSISYEIITSHNGYLWAENRKEKGTRMIIILPTKHKEKTIYPKK